ncbi:MAG: glycosyltransferase family 39 protein, partial [Ignavibacteriaceae bacterium]|nr:glycosyltransferase family 39 protein [Ignavibacteriaceae bacterium]
IRLHGAGIFPDSVYYISVARNIANGSGFVGYDGYYYVLQPPLYPVLLGAIKILLNTDPLISSGYVNAVLFGLTIYLAGLFFLKYLKSYTLVLLGTVSILISFVFIQIALTALSEPLFILLVLLFIYFLEKYYVKPDITSLIIFSTAASLACLTRYIGIVLILTGVISILIQNNRLFKEKIRRIAIFLFISCLPIGLWIIRNISLSGTFSGQRADSSYTLSENIKFLVNTILKWYLQIQITGLQVIIISIIIAALLVLLIKRHKQKSLADINKLSPTLIFILLYTLLLIISSTTTAYDYIANRLLSPIYLPVFLISFFIIDNILIWLSKYYRPKVLTAFFAAGLIAWMIYPAAKTVYIINDYVKLSGFGFNSSSWDNLETINYLNKNKELGTDYMVYSNVPEAVYILSDIKARWSPAKTLYNSPLTVNNESNLKYIFGRNNNICLVWFYKMDRNFLYSIDELQKNLNFEKIADFKDGSIYILRKVN